MGYVKFLSVLSLTPSRKHHKAAPSSGGGTEQARASFPWLRGSDCTQQGTSSEWQRIERSGHPLMEELVLCSAEMEESEGTVHNSEAWTDTIHSLRRDEVHQQHNNYMLLLTASATAPQWKSNWRVRDEGESSSEDYWKSECACLLVHCLWGRGSWCAAVTKHWVTLCGFSFTSAFLTTEQEQCPKVKRNLKKTSPYYYQQKLNLTTKFPWLAATLFIL